MSLSANGIPCNAPRCLPAAISAAAAFACRRARSNVGVMNARVCASYCSTRWMSASSNSTGESFRAAIRRASSVIGRSWSSVVMGALIVLQRPGVVKRAVTASASRLGQPLHRQLADRLAHRGADLGRVAVVHPVVDTPDGDFLHEVVDAAPRAHRAAGGVAGGAELRHRTGAELGGQHGAERG